MTTKKKMKAEHNEFPADLLKQVNTETKTTKPKTSMMTVKEILNDPKAGYAARNRLASILKLKGFGFAESMNYIHNNNKWKNYNQADTEKNLAGCWETFDKKDKIRFKISSGLEEILSREKRKVQRLGQGLHEGKFYYGAIIGNQLAVITSNREVYRLRKELINPNAKKPEWNIIDEIKNDFHLNYRYGFSDDAIDFPWSHKGIKGFLNGEIKPRPLIEIITEIADLNKKYVYHPNDQTHNYVACDIFSSYGFSLFPAKGRTYFNADKGSGKSKQSKIYKLLSFNSMWTTKGTPAQIYRDNEATCGTMIIDNADRMNKELAQEIYSIFETGLYPDAVSRLTNPKKSGTEQYQNYCPMVFNNIVGLPENTVDKSFHIRMLKTNIPEIAKRDLVSASRLVIWENLRNEMRVWWMENYQNVLDEIEKGVDTKLYGRSFDVVQAVLMVAQMCGEKFYRGMKEYVEEEQEQAAKPDIGGSIGFSVFYGIRELMDGADEKNIYPSDIARDYVMPEKYPGVEPDDSEYKKKFGWISRKVTQTITTIPFFRDKKMHNGKIYIPMKWKDVERYWETMGYHLLDVEEKEKFKPKKKEQKELWNSE